MFGRLRMLLMGGALGAALAYFADPNQGRRRRDRAARSLRDASRRGRRRIDSATETLRKAVG